MGSKPFNNPFAETGKALKKALSEQRGEAERAAKRAKEAEEARRLADKRKQLADRTDEELFVAAAAGTKRMADPRGVTPKPLPPPNAAHVPVFDEDAEVLAQLASLVEGTGRFDIADTDEYIEGAVEGLDRRILKNLRLGHYSFSQHVDLHGMRRDEAREAVEQFIVKSRREGQRCVLIVHGRGLNSKDHIPVLKNFLRSWLERGRIAKSVLAFTTARPHDGGAGAVYVLLRR